MATDWLRWQNFFGCEGGSIHQKWAGLSVAAIVLTAGTAVAQVVPDDTLGGDRSTVTGATVRNLPAELIQGGAVRGENLFHSFSQFNVRDGQRVYFANPAGITNILNRVTGADPSRILGTLGVDGSANLFLINPNGILFGSNARLDIAGSFLASTAHSLLLNNGLTFSATNPAAPPLLTINLRPGLQYGPNSTAGITNAGNLAVGQDLTLAATTIDLQGQLRAGRDLTLTATDSVRIRDSVTSPFIAVAAGQLLIQGDRSVDIFALNHPNSGFFSGGDMVLRSANTVGGDAHYTAGGSFRIEKLDSSPGSLYSPHDPVIRASGDVTFFAYEGASLHILAGGRVDIPGYVWIQAPDPVNGIAESVRLANGSEISINGRTEPTLDIRAGTTAFAPAGTVGLGGDSNVFAPSLFATTPTVTATPTSADITIGTIYFAVPPIDPATGGGTPLSGTILLTNQYQPNPNLTGSISVTNTVGGATLANRAIVNGDFNQGGVIELHSKGGITINGVVNADPTPFVVAGNVLGDGGSVRFRADGDITFTPGSLVFASGLSGGSITIDSGGTFSATGSGTNLLQESGIASTSSGLTPGAKGGAINIRARSVLLSDRAKLQTDTVGVREGGDINIQAQFISLTGGSEILTRTFGGGQAGDIIVNVPGTITLSGTAPLPLDANGFAVLNANDTPNGGFSSGFFVSTENLPTPIGAPLAPPATGNGGNLTINAGTLNIDNGAVLSSRSRSSGNGGTIRVTANTLSLTNGGEIVAPTYGTGTAGDTIIAANTIAIAGTDLTYATRFSQIQNAYIAAGLTDPTQSFQRTQFTVDPAASASAIVASDLGGLGKAGNVNVLTQALTLSGGAEILTQTFGAQPGGNIRIDPLNPSLPSSVTISGVAPFTGLDALSRANGGFSSGLIANAEDGATGRGGDITVNTTALRLDSGGVLSARNRGTGVGGNIAVNVNTLDLSQGGQILTVAYKGGDAGNIAINAIDQITISGFDPDFDSRFDRIKQAFLADQRFNPRLTETEAFERTRFLVDPFVAASGLQAAVDPAATANGGTINVRAGSISIADQGQIAAGTFGRGNAGRILLTADNAATLTSLSTIRNSVESGGIGSAGGIDITARSLTLTDGAQIQSGVFRPLGTAVGGIGQGGNIQINVADSVTLAGLNLQERLRSGLFVSTEKGAIGEAGSITINTGNLTVSDFAIVNAATTNRSNAGSITFNIRDSLTVQNSGLVSVSGTDLDDPTNINIGNPGNLNITAGTIVLRQAGSLQAVTASGSNANINLNVRGGIFMFPRDTEISAEARNNGNGGNITIRAAGVFSALADNNDIVANAFAGTGGNIDATRVLISPRRFRQFDRTIGRTSESDFIASSEIGQAGTVEIVTQERLQEALPANLVDRSGQIAPTCRANAGNGSEFIETGRGGLPANPFAPLSAESVLVDWVSLQADHRAIASPATAVPRTQTAEIVEAQGMMTDRQGNIFLVAQASTVSPQAPQPRLACPSFK